MTRRIAATKSPALSALQGEVGNTEIKENPARAIL